MTEERSQCLRHREHELPVREVKKDLVRQVLGKQQRPLLAARRAQVEAFAAEGSEVVVPTRRVCAPNASHSEPVVSAGQEPLADPLRTEHAVLGGGVPLIEDVAELLQKPFEDRVQLISAPGDVASPGRSRGSSCRRFHVLQDARETHLASLHDVDPTY